MDRHDAHAGPRERQEAVGRVDEVGRLAAQQPRQPDLLEEHLRAAPAALLDDPVLDARPLGQRVDELAHVAPPAAQLRIEGVAGIDGDDRHARNDLTPRRAACARRPSGRMCGSCSLALGSGAWAAAVSTSFAPTTTARRCERARRLALQAASLARLPRPVASFWLRALRRAQAEHDTWSIDVACRPAELRVLLDALDGAPRIAEIGTAAAWTTCCLTLAQPGREVHSLGRRGAPRARALPRAADARRPRARAPARSARRPRPGRPAAASTPSSSTPRTSSRRRSRRFGRGSRRSRPAA